MPVIDETAPKTAPIDLDAIRERLEGTSGPAYWRSLDELAGSPEFEQWLHAEFPRHAAALPETASGVQRREFLKLIGASLAFAGAAACTRQPTEKIVPAVKAPEDTPGRPLFFATAMPAAGYGTGLLVESHEGRPTKIEGNPEHPASLGATDVFGQASILTLYDPDRSQLIRRVNEVASWEGFTSELAAILAAQEKTGGAGLRVLVGTVTSPTLADQLAKLEERFPEARIHYWEPVNRDQAHAGSEIAYGEPLDAVVYPGRADVLVSLDDDFLGSGPEHLRHIREWTRRRRPTGKNFEGARLYAAESTFTTTGSVADERLPVRASDIATLAAALAHRLGVGTANPELSAREAQWADAVAEDLQSHRARGAVLVGENQPPAVHALGWAMNERLGNVGRVVETIEPVASSTESHWESITKLTTDIRAGRVDTLLLLETNPVYDAPAELAFGNALESVPHAIHLGLYDDETGRLSRWHIPAAHYLESWGDLRSGDGTASVQQPLIAPLYQGKSALEILALASGEARPSGYDLVRAHWKQVWGEAGFEGRWERALHDGIVEDTRAPTRRAALRAGAAHALDASQTDSGDGLEVTYRMHPTVGDGSFANNGWLQECPVPLTKLTWDNVVLVAPRTAEELGVHNGDVVAVEVGSTAVTGPVWILPGQPAGSLSLQLGYGRTRAGHVGNDRGFDVYPLRTAGAPWFRGGATVRKTGETAPLACTQHHGTLEGRHIVRSATVEEYREDPAFAQHIGHTPTLDDTLYPNYEYKDHAWGMAIDLNACVGCNACLVACQSENNIPVVGPEQVAMGREMHWLRVDRYWAGDLEEPDAHYQPMLCQHCERAPCEVVCPVNATVHDSEGLNLMVYNRCVGTRYCSNNCPYKVRRFNFYLYTDWETESLKLQRNPDVTVRSRGVMEKCTYCIQRINHGRNEARKDGRDVEDGEIVTACQQVCPADAIVFGDINDPESRVAKAKADPRNYSVLADLNTRPRTTYLASVKNPNPDLHDEEDDETTGGHG